MTADDLRPDADVPTEPAGKVRPLTDDERAELRQGMTEAAAWMRAELARRRGKKNDPNPLA